MEAFTDLMLLTYFFLKHATPQAALNLIVNCIKFDCERVGFYRFYSMNMTMFPTSKIQSKWTRITQRRQTMDDVQQATNYGPQTR